MISFGWPWAFLLLPAPWLIRRLLPPASDTGTDALRVPFFSEILALESARQRQPRLSAAFLRLTVWTVWLLLVLSVARPQWLGDPVALPVTGRDLMLAVDISGSMERDDFVLRSGPATRLDVVKAAARQFIKRRTGDRLGLILFGTQAYLQTPLTFDGETVAAMLDEAVVGLAGKETAIGLALKRFSRQGGDTRVLVLLTDGVNTAGEVDPRRAASMAAKEGLRIYTIGLGAESMRVQGILGTRVINPSADLDEETLRAIARDTGGRYFRATATETLEAIYDELDRLEPVTEEPEYFRARRSLYFWPLGLALVLSALLAASRLGLWKRLAASEAAAQPSADGG